MHTRKVDAFRENRDSKVAEPLEPNGTRAWDQGAARSYPPIVATGANARPAHSKSYSSKTARASQGVSVINRDSHRLPVTYFRACFDHAAPLLRVDLRRFRRPSGKARTRRPRRCSSLLRNESPASGRPRLVLSRIAAVEALSSAHRSSGFHRSGRQVFSHVGISSNPEGSAPVACAAALDQRYHHATRTKTFPPTTSATGSGRYTETENTVKGSPGT
jgi:hypothetical protein